MKYDILDKFTKRCILKLLRSNGCYIKHLNKSLRNESELVLEALNNNGLALQYVGDAYKSDKNYTTIAVIKDAKSIVFLDQELLKDKDYMIFLLKETKNPIILDHIDRSIRYDDEICKLSRELRYIEVDNNFNATNYKYTKESNYGLLDFVKETPHFLECLNRELCSDISLIAYAVENNYSLIQSQYIRNDEEILKALHSRNL